MSIYEDDTVLLDDTGIFVKNYFYPGHRRHIPYPSIVGCDVLETGSLTGRLRLVGFGFRRPRHFFTWDRRRRGKRFSIALDLGRTIRPVFSPDDHLQVLEVLQTKLSTVSEDF